MSDCAVGPQLLTQCSASSLEGTAADEPVEIPCGPKPFRTASGVSPSIDSASVAGPLLKGPSTDCEPSVTECTQSSLELPTYSSELEFCGLSGLAWLSPQLTE